MALINAGLVILVILRRDNAVSFCFCGEKKKSLSPICLF